LLKLSLTHLPRQQKDTPHRVTPAYTKPPPISKAFDLGERLSTSPMFVNEMLVFFASWLFAVLRIQDSTPGPIVLVDVNEAVNTLLQDLTPPLAGGQVEEWHEE
jgi:hypothetical protein